MSLRLTLGKVRPTIAKALNLCSTSEEIVSYVNRAQERLIYRGKFVGTYGRYRVCLKNSCVTWPREIETIECYALDSIPGTIHNGWYEFLGSGRGVLDSTSSAGHQIVDRGDAVAFDDVTGSNSKLAIYADVEESTTTKVIVQFYDQYGNWVRRNIAGTWIDGEQLTIPTPGAYATTVNVCRPYGLVRVIKPITNGVIRLYEYDLDTLVYKPLAYYEPSEELPVYRRSLIPGLTGTTTGDTTCDYRNVTIMGKLRHIPVAVDNDFLIIGHLDAIRLACQAIKFEEASKPDFAEVYWNMAFKCLDDQLHHWNGDGVTVPLRVESSRTFGCHLERVQ